MLFWPLEREILSLFATFWAFCNFVSIIFCNFEAYFSEESTQTYLLKFSHRISTSIRETNEQKLIPVGVCA